MIQCAGVRCHASFSETPLQERKFQGTNGPWNFHFLDICFWAKRSNTLLRYTVCQQHTVVYDGMRLAECYCASVAKKCSL